MTNDNDYENDPLKPFLEALDTVDTNDRAAVMKLMDKLGLSTDDQLDAWDLLDVLKESEKEANKSDNLDPINIDNVDALADAAKGMADEDKTDVEVTEIDKDEDGDTDKVTIKKENPEKDGASDEEDNPHDQGVVPDKRPKNVGEPENSANLLARHLGSLGRFEY